MLSGIDQEIVRIGVRVTFPMVKKKPQLSPGLLFMQLCLAYLATCRLSPGPLPWVGPVARMSPVETIFTHSVPLLL